MEPVPVSVSLAEQASAPALRNDYEISRTREAQYADKERRVRMVNFENCYHTYMNEGFLDRQFDSCNYKFARSSDDSAQIIIQGVPAIFQYDLETRITDFMALRGWPAPGKNSAWHVVLDATLGRVYVFIHPLRHQTARARDPNHEADPDADAAPPAARTARRASDAAAADGGWCLIA